MSHTWRPGQRGILEADAGDRSHFDAPALLEDGVLPRDGESGIQVRDFDDVDADDNLFGLQKRPIGNHVAPDRGGCGRVLERECRSGGT